MGELVPEEEAFPPRRKKGKKKKERFGSPRWTKEERERATAEEMPVAEAPTEAEPVRSVKLESEPVRTVKLESEPARSRRIETTEVEDERDLKELMSFEKRFGAKKKAPLPEGEDSAAFPGLPRSSDSRFLWKYIVVGAAAVVLIASIFAILTLAREGKRAYDNLQKRNEASQMVQDKNRQDLDYQNQFNTGLHDLDAGTVAAYEAAIASFDRSLKAKADYRPPLAWKAELLALLAIEHEKVDRLAEGCQLADKALAAGPKAADALRAKAACLLGSDKAEDAVKLVQQAIIASENDAVEDAESNYVLALIHLKQKDLDKAVDALKAVVAANPLHFRGHYLLADALASKKLWPDAVAEATKAVQLQQGHLAAKQRLADYQAQATGANAQAGAVPGLREELGAEMDKKAKSTKLLAEARAAMNRGATNQALGLLNEVMALGVHAGQAYMLKCQLYVNSGNYAAAIEACSAARNYSADAYYFLGAAYEAMGNDALKRENYQAYLYARPDGRYANDVRSILGVGQE